MNAIKPIALYKEKLLVLSQIPEYANSMLLFKLTHQKKNKAPLAAFSDIDGTYTFTPKNKLEQLKYTKATSELTELLTLQSIPIIAMTGRDLPAVLAGQRPDTENLPPFDVIASSVGTEVYIRQTSGTYLQSTLYQAYVNQCGFQWDRIYAVCSRFIHAMARLMPQLHLRFQSRDNCENIEAYKINPIHAVQKTKQPPPQPYKISMDFDGTLGDTALVRNRLKKALRAAGVPRMRIVISSDNDPKDPAAPISFALDVVPVSKIDAVNWMTKLFGCRGIVAGNSGNDTHMIMYGGDAGIIVANARTELMSLINTFPIVSQMTILEDTLLRTVLIGQNKRLLYIDDQGLNGPLALLRATRAFLHLFNATEKE